MDKAIKKIVLDLGGKEVTLTPEQAKNLKTALDDLFGKEIVKEIHHHDYQPYHWYWDHVPYYQQPQRFIPTDPIWCSSSSGMTMQCLDSGSTLKLTG